MFTDMHKEHSQWQTDHNFWQDELNIWRREQKAAVQKIQKILDKFVGMELPKE